MKHGKHRASLKRAGQAAKELSQTKEMSKSQPTKTGRLAVVIANSADRKSYQRWLVSAKANTSAEDE